MSASDFTFGIEEEFFLVNPRTRNVVTRAPKRLLKLLMHELGEQVAHELLQSQLEIVSPVFDDVSTALHTMRSLRLQVNHAVTAAGLRLMAAGTHPLAVWSDQIATETPRYDQLMEDFKIIGRRNVVCGLHVHVEIPTHVDRIEVMNRATRWLPLFLALSASSPFWNRQRTGLKSYRQSAYDEWPRSGIPEVFMNEAEFAGFMELMQRSGAARDATQLWWAIRPSAKLPTLEMRIADACTHVEDGIAIAAAYRCLIAMLVRDPAAGRQRTAATRPIVDENRWRAKRYGVAAQFIDDESGQLESVGAALLRLRDACGPEIAQFGCADCFDWLDMVARQGGSADRQLELYAARRAAGESRTQALQHVVDWLIATTLPGDNAAARLEAVHSHA